MEIFKAAIPEVTEKLEQTESIRKHQDDKFEIKNHFQNVKQLFPIAYHYICSLE
jgi:hypothetical protein